jgi:peptide/nickel transport system permease protein
MAISVPDRSLAEEHIGGAPPSEETDHTIAPAPPKGDIWRRFRRNRLAMIGLVLIVLIVLAAVFADFLTTGEPGEVNTGDANQRLFSPGHPLGTDRVGRDLYTDVLYGARVSLRIGLFAGLIAASIGIVVGAISAFYGRWIDTTIMRFTDILLSLPYILIALAIITVVGPGERTVILVLGLLGWMAIARVLRASIMQVMETEYVDAARALGAPNRRIIFRHILPNTIQPVIVYTTLFIGAAVLSEAALSFLGVGVQRPTPAWGLMVAEGRRSLANYPHMLFVPAIALSILVTAAVFVGDGLRDALDPKLK